MVAFPLSQGGQGGLASLAKRETGRFHQNMKRERELASLVKGRWLRESGDGGILNEKNSTRFIF